LLSNSDAHSLPNLGREANVFDLKEISYDEIYNVIKSHGASHIPQNANAGHANDKKESYLDYTIEFYPEEGMYHWDGHRACGIRFSPEETKKHKGECPVCRKPLVIGVEYRVDELADRPKGYKPAGAPGFKKLVELDKIIAEAMGVKSRSSKKVIAAYNDIVSQIGTELRILLDEPLESMADKVPSRILEGIRRVRAGELIVEPGYDGEYGRIKIFKDSEKGGKPQPKLF